MAQRRIHDGAILTAVYILLCLAIITYGTYELIYLSVGDQRWARLAFLATEPFALLFLLFPLKLFVFNLTTPCGSWQNLRVESKYHRPHPPQPPCHPPPVVIQVPVYKESFEQTIRPTLENALEPVRHYRDMGGSAFIFVCDDGLTLVDEAERTRRVQWYERNGIAYVARPPHKELPRAGIFKKASNLNYCLDFALAADAAPGETHAERVQFALDARIGNPMAGGPVTAEFDYILQIDADTRLPSHCLYTGVGEFLGTETVGFVQYAMSVLRQSENNFVEATIAHFTNHLYSLFIAMGTANGEPAPLVGHCVYLNWSLMRQVKIARGKFWSEAHVSEDFDLSMRMQAVPGVVGRYATYNVDEWKEGVSLTFTDEIIKLRKFAYGAGEMVLHPVCQWCRKGVLTPLIKNYLRSKTVPFAAKVNMIAYLGTFYAMWWGFLVLPFSFYISALGDFWGLLTSFQILIGLIIVFSVIGNAATIIHSSLLGMGSIPVCLLREVLYAIPLGVFWGAAQYHICTAMCSYLLGITPEWGATRKELAGPTRAWREALWTLREFKWMYAVLLTYAGGIVAFYQFVEVGVSTYVLVPFYLTLATHAAGPLVLNPLIVSCPGWLRDLMREKPTRVEIVTA